MKYIFQKPMGVKDFLPTQVRKKKQLERIIEDVFEKWGYEEVIAPSFEYLETFLLSNRLGFSEKVFKFFDRKGAVMALRPDMTTSIARMVATHYSEHLLPLRFCYTTNVFRFQKPRKGREQEFFQVGAELIGIDGIEADMEIILLAAKVLNKAGIRNFTVNIGHVKFLEGLLDEIPNPSSRQLILQTILDRNFIALESIAKDIDFKNDVKDIFMSLTKYYGGMEIIKELAGLPLNRKCQDALLELAAIDKVLSFHDIELTFDPAFARDMDYYTGIIFELYSPKSGFPLGGGGRYDGLMDKFDVPRPATGFALTEEVILSALEKDLKDCYAPHYLYYDNDNFIDVLKQSEQLREQGFIVKLIPNKLCKGD